MAEFELGQHVEVRGRPKGNWWPGEIAAESTLEWEVVMDQPFPTANEWSGMSRKIGGSLPVERAWIKKQLERMPDTAGKYIRTA